VDSEWAAYLAMLECKHCGDLAFSAAEAAASALEHEGETCGP